ncbi:PEP-CTERM sorting domain-containing protein [Bythopirellula goksoeyrii]|uniref:PEP-CTERM protein-sorting domain-containing protein n=1 Tax=Bythopirellula goksoeyrii TaxID=1400387 RepID=A0A5B9Q7S3_9BACT|nr:PEP-CTERM sorting domain-containing protein [Bythopirellula goksoeyrii]QEG32916.1 hypothetical protein Pr1d_01770 [Bythopirellula goksoeyrii]
MKSKIMLTIAAILICCQSAFAALQINEIYVSPEDPKDDRQFFELFSSTGTTSLNNVWFLEIEGDLPIEPTQLDNPGQVLNAFDLSAFSTGSNGLFLRRDSATVIDIDPLTSGVQGPDGATTVDVGGFSQIFGYDEEDINEDPIFENNVHSYLLVEGFTGAIGDDLDGDDDGVLDVAWTGFHDGVSQAETGDAGYQYASQFGGNDILLGFGADVYQRRPSDGLWMFFDSSSGDGEPAGFNGPFFANDGSGPGDSDAAFEDGTEITVNPSSMYLFATPGGANVQIPEPTSVVLLTLLTMAGFFRRSY